MAPKRTLPPKQPVEPASDDSDDDAPEEVTGTQAREEAIQARMQEVGGAEVFGKGSTVDVGCTKAGALGAPVPCVLHAGVALSSQSHSHPGVTWPPHTYRSSG